MVDWFAEFSPNTMKTMQATALHGIGDIRVDTVAKPSAGLGAALLQLTATAICGPRSSLGVYSGRLQIPCEAYAAGLGGHRSVTTLCPGEKARMRRLTNAVQSGRFDPTMLVTHRFHLADIKQGYEVSGNRSEGVLKVAITS
jgi:threonine dehydrogenase-like Zn-dependent dehydrogenase